MERWFKRLRRLEPQCLAVFGKKTKGKSMKKILVAFGIMFPIFAYAESMCVKDGSIMVVLDPQIGGTALSSNVTGKTWSTQFGYGVVSGIGGCIDTMITIGQVAGNQTSITPYTSGARCYCKMLHPVESLWVYTNACGGKSGTCLSYCASYCSSGVATDVAIRVGMFGNIVQ